MVLSERLNFNTCLNREMYEEKLKVVLELKMERARRERAPEQSADMGAPCTLHVGNLPTDTSEEELKAVFSKLAGYKRLMYRTKHHGPMCYVEFENVLFATEAINQLGGYGLINGRKGGLQLRFTKIPLAVRISQASEQDEAPADTGPNFPPTESLSNDDLDSLSMLEREISRGTFVATASPAETVEEELERVNAEGNSGDQELSTEHTDAERALRHLKEVAAQLEQRQEEFRQLAAAKPTQGKIGDSSRESHPDPGSEVQSAEQNNEVGAHKNLDQGYGLQGQGETHKDTDMDRDNLSASGNEGNAYINTSSRISEDMKEEDAIGLQTEDLDYVPQLAEETSLDREHSGATSGVQSKQDSSHTNLGSAGGGPSDVLKRGSSQDEQCLHAERPMRRRDMVLNLLRPRDIKPARGQVELEFETAEKQPKDEETRPSTTIEREEPTEADKTEGDDGSAGPSNLAKGTSEGSTSISEANETSRSIGAPGDLSDQGDQERPNVTPEPSTSAAGDRHHEGGAKKVVRQVQLETNEDVYCIMIYNDDSMSIIDRYGYGNEVWGEERTRVIDAFKEFEDAVNSGDPRFMMSRVDGTTERHTTRRDEEDKPSTGRPSVEDGAPVTTSKTVVGEGPNEKATESGWERFEENVAEAQREREREQEENNSSSLPGIEGEDALPSSDKQNPDLETVGSSPEARGLMEESDVGIHTGDGVHESSRSPAGRMRTSSRNVEGERSPSLSRMEEVDTSTRETQERQQGSSSNLPTFTLGDGSIEDYRERLPIIIEQMREDYKALDELHDTWVREHGLESFHTEYTRSQEEQEIWDRLTMDRITSDELKRRIKNYERRESDQGR
ncbi:hypothetical protein B0T20DRAFT_165580 [Sordaria brevicollis]|uniref:RRM domain-containing protein n=1 Tax=Sordaria brevicollis TaxID=83679 RepID=A0AAE0PGU0_SORBR|nr:hypothetical protein B0T20DRAFT_165580 [Sordaria brevicollis]